MKKKISANDCKLMFNDRFNYLTMKELGIELKHFSVGTAPETPSFLVNQDELKRKIIEKFCAFFDANKSQGLEIIFLKSNYGNGKSHFLRTIYTFLDGYENVITKEVSLKQEEMDLKKKILESVSQKIIKECAAFLINSAEKEALSEDEAAVLMALEEKYALNNANLAKLLYIAAGNSDITSQVKAIAILKGNYLPEYLQDLGYSGQELNLNGDFYCCVIRMLSIYLREINYYLVVVFDEYEHVFSWENEKYRKNMYEDIKHFTGNIKTFKNMFFIFAESDSVDNESESSDDPALKSRKPNLTYQIADISSKEEIGRLFDMILKRYEKYYEVSFKEYVDDILKLVYEDPMIREKTNYRGYTQSIMRALEKFKDEPSMSKKEKMTEKDDNKNVKLKNTDMSDNIAKERFDKWKKATSISKKTILYELLETMIDASKEIIVSKSKKRGEYVTRIQNLLKRYRIISTDNPSKKDLKKRLDNLNNIISDEREEVYILYPELKEEIAIEENVKIIFYSDITVENAFKLVYGNEIKESDMNVYLSILDIRRNNAKD